MTAKTKTSGPTLVFFDGDCSLCARAVKFVENRSTPDFFKFIDLKGIPENDKDIFPPDTSLPGDRISLWQNNELLSGPDAVYKIIRSLRFPWNLLYILRFLPKRWNNRMYFFVATHRHQWKIRG